MASGYKMGFTADSITQGIHNTVESLIVVATIEVYLPAPNNTWITIESSSFYLAANETQGYLSFDYMTILHPFVIPVPINLTLVAAALDLVLSPDSYSIDGNTITLDYGGGDTVEYTFKDNGFLSVAESYYDGELQAKFVYAETYTDIDVYTAHEMINNNSQYPDLIVLDVRTQEEYDEGHLCEAILIPVGELAIRVSELEPYKDTEIIVYCRTGGRSSTGSQILVDNNFTKVYNMEGGITVWEAAGYEICLDENGQDIKFSFGIFVLILISTVSILLVGYKKKLNRK